MVNVTFTDASMVVTVVGAHKVWTLKSQLTVPLCHIDGARIDAAVVKRGPRGLRAPGTFIPGVIVAGTYRARGNKQFWDVVHKAKAIVVDLSDSDFRQLVIEVDDPEATVARINRKIGRSALRQGGSRAS